MKDLTTGSITRHIVTMAVPIAAGMIFQTLYYLVDLYFVAQLGDAAIAGVSAAGNVMFIIFALTQVLGVGTAALIAHAVGRKDQSDASLIFNQSLVLAFACAVFTIAAGYSLTGYYLETVAADAATSAAGREYLFWFLPAMALQFAMISMGSALRGTGIVQPTMVVQVVTVIMNIILAPILIAGWLTGYAMGVAGAGLASSISVAAGVLMLAWYFSKLETYVGFRREQWRPHLPSWRRMLGVGLPAGGEFLMLFFYMALVYWVIRGFGPEAQAGFGIGSRIMQSIFLPAMAVGFAAAPVAGQNFGARNAARVRETFTKAVLITSLIMGSLTLICQIKPSLFIHPFTDEATVEAIGAQFLQIASWNFVAQGFIFSSSSMFQAMGNTVPALISSAARVVTFAIPAIWLASRPGFTIEQVWFLSVATILVQAIASFLLVRVQLRSRLAAFPAAA